MEDIILQIIKKNIKFQKNMTFSEMVSMIQDNIGGLSSELLSKTLEFIDDNLMNSPARKKSWDIIRYDFRTINTVFGKVTFKRRYYRNKYTKQYSYLLDESINIIPRQRLDVTLESKILEFANVLSYEKSGKMVSDYTSVTKQTVKNILFKFSKKEKSIYPDFAEKKVIKTLFIEADEDHVSLQKSKKQNSINKLIYVHEGKISDGKNRKFLLNKHIFASNLQSPEDMWIEVYDYIYSKYDVTKIEKIFILGDGARWIKTGLEWLENSEFVLDSFHMNKAILKISGGQSRVEYGGSFCQTAHLFS